VPSNDKYHFRFLVVNDLSVKAVLSPPSCCSSTDTQLQFATTGFISLALKLPKEVLYICSECSGIDPGTG
jgi:hypothetical protein